MIYPKRPFQAEAPGCAKGKREKWCFGNIFPVAMRRMD